MADIDLADMLDSWVLSLRSDRKSPNTIRTYRMAVDQFLVAGHTTLDRRTYRAFISDIPNASTANVRARALRLFSAFLLDEGEVDENPLKDVKAPKPDDKLVPSLSDSDVESMLKVCNGASFHDRRDHALLMLGLESGLRAEEVLALRLEDVDVKAQTLIVQRGKGGRPRMVMFGPQAARSLDRYMRLRRKHRQANSPMFWLGTGSVKLTYQGLNSTLKRRARKAGVEFHFHMLRHTYASRWLDAGHSEGALMNQAGWKNRGMLDRYVQDRAASLAMDEARRRWAG